MVLLTLILLSDLDNPFEGQDAVKRRRSGIHFPRKSLQRRQHCVEDGLVHLYGRLRTLSLDGKACIDSATRELFRPTHARGHFDGVPTGWQAEAQVQALRVDRLDFPRPRISAGNAMASSKSGHAR